MNKKLMALGLVIGMSFSQMPQAGFFSKDMITSKLGFLYDVAKQHPVYSLVAASSLLGVSYLAYNRNRIGNYINNTITQWGQNSVNKASAELDVHGIYNMHQALDNTFLQDVRVFLNDANSAWTTTFQFNYEHRTLHTLVTVTKNEMRNIVTIEIETWEGIAKNKAERVEQELKLINYSNPAAFNDAIVQYIQQTLRGQQ